MSSPKAFPLRRERRGSLGSLHDSVKRSAELHRTAHFNPEQRAARGELVSAALARFLDLGESDPSAVARVVDEMVPDPLRVKGISKEARNAAAKGLGWVNDSPTIFESVDDRRAVAPARSEILGWFARGRLGEVEKRRGVAFLPPDVLAIREEIRQVIEGERMRLLLAAPPATRSGCSRKGDIALLRGPSGHLLEEVRYSTAEEYLGIRERQRQKLMNGPLVSKRKSFITVESLMRYLPPQKNPH